MGKVRGSRGSKLVVVVVVLAGVGLAAWWGLHLGDKPEPASQTVQVAETPKVCASAANLCLESDWQPQDGWITSDGAFGLASPDGTATLTFINDTADMKPEMSCESTCSMSVISAEPMKQLTDTQLVRAIFQETDNKVIQSFMFLISSSSYAAQGLVAGQTKATAYAYPSPTFQNTVDGKAYEAQLIALNYEPGNFLDEAAARKWFDSESAKTAFRAIQGLTIGAR